MENQKTFLNKKLNFNLNFRILKLGLSQEVDWKIIFISTSALAILIIGLSVFTFIKIDKGEIFLSKESVGEKEELDIKLLKETVYYYKNKAMEFEKIKSSKPVGVDPSL